MNKYKRETRDLLIIGIMQKHKGYKGRIDYWKRVIWGEWPNSARDIIPSVATITRTLHKSERVQSSYHSRGHFRYYLFWIPESGK